MQKLRLLQICLFIYKAIGYKFIQEIKYPKTYVWFGVFI